MNRLSNHNTGKWAYLLCLIVGFLLLFLTDTKNHLLSAILKITGFALVMYGLYNISNRNTISNEGESPSDKQAEDDL